MRFECIMVLVALAGWPTDATAEEPPPAQKEVPNSADPAASPPPKIPKSIAASPISPKKKEKSSGQPKKSTLPTNKDAAIVKNLEFLLLFEMLREYELFDEPPGSEKPAEKSP